MKRILLLLLLTTFSLAPVIAETVLVCISADIPEIERGDWPVSVMRAVEDGILDRLFESGHIVTNCFSDSDSAEALRKAADVNGAVYAVGLNIEFSAGPDENLPMPILFDYRIFRRGLGMGESESVSMNDLAGSSDEQGLELCRYAGLRLGEITASMLSSF